MMQPYADMLDALAARREGHPCYRASRRLGAETRGLSSGRLSTGSRGFAAGHLPYA